MSYLPDMQSHSVVIFSSDAVCQRRIGFHQAGPVPNSSRPVGAVLPMFLQEGNADFALLIDL